MGLYSASKSNRSTPGFRIWIPLLMYFLTIIPGNRLYSQAFTEITALETDNSFPGVWCCANDGYIYGVGLNQRTVIFRKRENGQSYERRGSVTSVDPSFIIANRIYSTTTPGLIFILVRNNSTMVHSLLKSNDGGLTFSKVYTFGQGNGPGGADSRDVRLLRGLLELTTDLPGGGGKGTLLIGEYNVNPSRTAGSYNDRVRIMKSTDNGDTWTKVVEWNTNGQNQVGHIHSMKQDPYTGEIYICIGDFSNKYGILKWNGTSSFSDNTPLLQIAEMPGFDGLIGMQRYRSCDVLFDENYFYTFADTQGHNNPDGAESGIWRGTKDFSSYTRVDNQIYGYDPMHIGWFGEKIGNTFIFTTAREYVSATEAWKEPNTRVYISNNGVNWYTTGQIDWRDTGDPTAMIYIANVFSYNNRFYLDCGAAAGHSATIQCSISRQWKSYEDPVILHPVYFVGRWNNNGNDNNSGANADSPKMTLGNILSNSRISAGSRVRISAGNYNEPALNPSWNTPTFQGTGTVVLEGSGMDATHIIRTSGSPGTYGLFLESITTLNTPLVLKDLDFYITADGGVDHRNYVLSTSDSYIKTIGCRIGNVLNDDSPLINLGGTGAKYESINSFHIASSQQSVFKDIVKINSPGTTIDMKNCVILNGYNSFTINYPETSFSLKSCTIYGNSNNGITLGSDNNSQPVIKDCILSSGSYPIQDLSGITENQVDYNLYCASNSNVTDGGHSPAIAVSPGFVDPDHGNFHLKPYSPGVLNGVTLPDALYDFLGRPRLNPPCLGAYEDTALIASPDSVTIESVSGSNGEFSVRSNTEWTINEFDSWITLSITSGSGSTTVNVTANSSNVSDTIRNTDLKIAGHGVDLAVIHVVQLPEVHTTPEEPTKPEEPTSVDEVEILPAEIYPNPVSSFLRLDLNDEDYKTFSIMNFRGDVLKKENVTEREQQIDFSNFSKGIYIIELRSPGKYKRFKVIKY